MTDLGSTEPGLDAPAGPPTPDPAAAPVPAADRMPLWSKIVIGVAIFLSVVIVAGFVIHVPYGTISPGEAVSFITPRDLVKIDGARTYPNPRGDIRLLFVRERNNISLWRYLQAKFDPNVDVFKEKVLNPSGLSQEELNQEAAQQMADAKTAAEKVALEAAGYKVTQAPGLTVSDFFPSNMPAEKVLKYGDVILSADGTKISLATDLSKVIRRHRAGEQVTLEIERNGKRQTVKVPIASAGQPAHPAIGVLASPRYSFPVKVDVDTAGIGGPSAGLAMTLAILDDLTPGSLTGGKRVAVTGTIDPVGNVGEIGGIAQKAVAVRASHSQLFIVPRCAPDDPPAQLASCQADLAKITKRVGDKIKVVPVATFADALRVLRENGGDPVETSTTTPTTSPA